MRGRPAVHRAHLGLSSRRGRLTRRVVQGALLAGCVLAVPVHAEAGVAARLSSRNLASTPSTFAGGTFSPAVAPVITQTFRGVNFQLGWQAVTFGGARPVTYLVTRIEPGGATVPVCTGVDAPVTSAGTVTCSDKKAPKGSLYTEQPVILVAGAVTWSLAPSTPA